MGAEYPQIGGTLGRYEIVEELGRGGMAVVFRAVDPMLDRAVAIKILHQHLWNESEYVTRFVREAKAVAKLRHPNIVEVYDFGGKEQSDNDQDDQLSAYIVGELISGPTLQQFVEQRGVPLPDVAAMIGIKLAEALECAHGQGVIHRDLKPENIMIADGGRIVLTDFGIARIVEGESVTQTGVLLGSPAYMSPEQARGEHVDHRSDLFSLGTVLYQLCTGRLPFTGKDPIATVLKILDGHPMPPQAICTQVSRPLNAAIMRMLQLSPDDRFASAVELGATLRNQLEEVGLHDVDEELTSYFRSPGPYNRTLIDRVVRSSLDLANDAFTRRAIPRALDFCDRVLSLSDNNPEALALVKRLSGRRRLRNAALALIAIAAAFTALTLWALSDSPVVVTADASHNDLAQTITARTHDASTASHDSTTTTDTAVAAVDTKPPDAPRKQIVRRFTRQPRTQPPRPEDAAVAKPDVTAATRKQPDAASQQPARVIIAVGPWCDAFIDGKPHGRSPMAQPITVAPGKHRLVCRQGRTTFIKPFVATAGKTVRITGMVHADVVVRLRLSRGDAVRVKGKQHKNGASLSLPPSRYRFEVMKKGHVIEGGWVTIPKACVFVDQPSLRCR